MVKKKTKQGSSKTLPPLLIDESFIRDVDKPKDMKNFSMFTFSAGLENNHVTLIFFCTRKTNAMFVFSAINILLQYYAVAKKIIYLESSLVIVSTSS